MFRGLKDFSKITFLAFTLFLYVERSSAHAQIPFSFFAAAPGPVCGGLKMGNFCWYGGAAGQSCDQACAAHGGCDLSGTRDYVGSGGSFANCSAVMDGLFGVGSGSTGTGIDIGCAMIGVARRWYYGPATTCASSYSSAVRICACNL